MYHHMRVDFTHIGTIDVSACLSGCGDMPEKLGLKQTVHTDNGMEYRVIQYKRPIRNQALGRDLGHFRSVIVRDGRVVCVAPPRALRMKEMEAEHTAYACTAEEVVEGTMINLFNDAGEWRIATRSTVGARCTFYKGSPTFRRMFLEAAGLSGLEFETLPKDVCYSFVLQHPKNRIVCKVNTAALYLVDRYRISEDGLSAVRVPYDDAVGMLLADTAVRFPDRWPMSDYRAVTDAYACSTTPFTNPGVMFRLGDSHVRAKVANPNYEAVRRLRGNHPKSQYRYLVLRQAGQVSQYLMHYPEDSSAFSAFAAQTDAFVKQLHSSYIRARPMKEGDGSVEEPLRPHVRGLHRVYVQHLRPRGLRVGREDAKAYVGRLPAARLMYVMNRLISPSEGTTRRAVKATS